MELPERCFSLNDKEVIALGSQASSLNFNGTKDLFQNRAIPHYGHDIQRANFLEIKGFFSHTPLQQFLFEVFLEIFLTIIGTELSAEKKKKPWISWTKAANIFVLNSVTDITNTSTSSFRYSS